MRLAEIAAQSTIDDLVHDLRNGLAGAHAALRMVRDPMNDCRDRDILTAVISRIDELNRRLIETE